MIFRALVLHQLFAEKLRSLMTLMAVALGVALVLAIDLANSTAIASFSNSVNIIAHHVNLQVVGYGPGFSERYFSQILGLPGVRDARPVIENSLTVGAHEHDPLSGDVLHVIGTDLLRPLPRSQADQADSQAVAAGVAQSPFSPSALLLRHGAIISTRIAQLLHIRTGDTMTALLGDRPVPFEVAAILPASSAGVDSSVVFIDVSTAQEVFGRIGTLDRIDIEVEPAALGSVTTAITALKIPAARVITPGTRDGEIQRMLQSFATNLEALAAIALLVGVFLVCNTVAISVVRRRAEIGILRGLGATSGVIVRSFLLEGALFGVVGSLLGIALGAWLAQTAVGAVSKTVASLYVSTHADGVIFSGWPIAKALLLGIGSAIAAAFVPARAAAQIAPAALIRSAATEPRYLWSTKKWLGAAAAFIVVGLGLARLPAIDSIPIFGYIAGLMGIGAGVMLTAPAVGGLASLITKLRLESNITLRLSAAQMHRARGRVSVAVATLMTAIAMMVSIAVLVSSFRTTVVAWANESLRADFFIKPLGLVDASLGPTFSPAVIERLRTVPGVAGFDTLRAISLPYQGRITTLAGTEMPALLRRPRLRILAGSLQANAAELRAGRDVIISEPFANRFGTTAGQNIVLPTAEGPTRFTVAAVYNDYSSDSGIILIDRATSARLYHDPGIDSIAVSLQPQANPEKVRRALLKAAAPAKIDLESTRELRRFVIEIFDRTFAITYALYIISIVIAVLGVVSTLFALVLERKREIGILRYLGLATAGVRSMVLYEAAGIGILGGALGIGVGLALALDLIYVINRQSFGWLIELEMPWTFLVTAFVAVILVAIAAGVIPANIAAKIRTSEALRDE